MPTVDSTMDVELAPRENDTRTRLQKASENLDRAYVWNPNRKGFVHHQFGVTNRKFTGCTDLLFSIIFGCTQLILTALVYVSSLDYAPTLGIENMMVVLISCSTYRFLVHMIGPFIREDVIWWNKFVSRMIFPNVATIVIWVIFLQPPLLLSAVTRVFNTMTIGAPGAAPAPSPVSTTFLIPTKDYIMLTVSMII